MRRGPGTLGTMTDARACRTFLLLAGLSALGGCAGGGSPPVPPQTSDAPHFSCPDGRSFVTQFDPNTQQTDLWLSDGGLHRLAPVPDPLGGVLYQDSGYQLRPGATDASKALTDRSTTRRETCVRGSVPAGSAGLTP